MPLRWRVCRMLVLSAAFCPPFGCALAAQAEQVVASTSRIQRDPSGNDGDVDTTGEPDELDPESEEED